MNNNKKQSEREILEEILQTLTEQKKTLEMIVPNPLVYAERCRLFSAQFSL